MVIGISFCAGAWILGYFSWRKYQKGVKKRLISPPELFSVKGELYVGMFLTFLLGAGVAVVFKVISNYAPVLLEIDNSILGFVGGIAGGVLGYRIYIPDESAYYSYRPQPSIERQFKARFHKKLSARLHMFLIMICTLLSCLVLSKIMLIVGLDSMLIRYPIVLVGSYLVLFVFMKLWLLYVTAPYRKQQADARNALEVLPPHAGRSADHGAKIEGGGGRFGGAGAGGAFEYEEGAAEAATDGVAEAASELAEKGGFLLAALTFILFFFLGGGAYLIYKAPLILSEAAFKVVPDPSLIESSRKMKSPDWIGSVFRTTWKPFLFTLLVSIVGALLLNDYCPQAIKLTEVFKECI
jgi:hypothetical protein